MNPILIAQLKKILASLTIILHLIYLQLANHQENQPVGSHYLGAATVTAGNTYPTSTNTFNDNDLINAGDLNLITTYIGIRSATDTVSLQGQIFNVSSTANNPPVATATGTLKVANGGTATGTYIYGIVVASSTNAFTTIAPGVSGNVLTSNGSAWTSITTSTVASTLSSSVTTSSVNFTMTSTSFMTVGTSTANGIASTTLSLVGAHRVQLSFDGTFLVTNAANCYITFTVDGVDVNPSSPSGGVIQDGLSVINTAYGESAVFITPILTAASHTFRAQVKADAGTLRVEGGTGSNVMWTFAATELYN